MAVATERVDLIFLLSQAAHALQTEMTAALEKIGVTPRMHCVLFHAQDGEFTQIQLAERCALDKTTMVVTMDALEQAGLAERRPSPTDRRARIIAVTDAGRTLVRRGDAIVADAVRGRPRITPRRAARAVRLRPARTDGGASGQAGGVRDDRAAEALVLN